MRRIFKDSVSTKSEMIPSSDIVNLVRSEKFFMSTMTEAFSVKVIYTTVKYQHDHFFSSCDS